MKVINETSTATRTLALGAVKGSVATVNVAPVTADTAAARRAWSKRADFFDVAASTRCQPLPPATVVRYQKRELVPSHSGAVGMPTNIGFRRAEMESAR